MKNPQTLAINIASRCSMIGKNACLAFTYIWCMGLEPEDGEAIKTVANAMRGEVIKEDCTVYAEPFLKYLTGKNWLVEKRKIKSLSELKKIDRCAVMFSADNGESGHWVGVEHGVIKFNSLEKSYNVSCGKPVTARIITLRE